MSPTDVPFEELEHTADLCLRVRARTLEALFVHAAQGMFHLMQCAPRGRLHPVSYDISLQACDLETLLVDWLGELLYLCERDTTCPDVLEIHHLGRWALDARVQGKRPCPPQRGIKAVTYSELQVVCGLDGFWEAVITLDV